MQKCPPPPRPAADTAWLLSADSALCYFGLLKGEGEAKCSPQRRTHLLGAEPRGHGAELRWWVLHVRDGDLQEARVLLL